MDTTGAVDLGAVRPSKAATTQAPVDTAPGPVRAVREAMEAVYDAALSKRQATMAVLPLRQMAEAAIQAAGASYPVIPDYDDGAARETKYRDRHVPEFDPEDYYVPAGGELPADALPEVAHLMVCADDAVYDAGGEAVETVAPYVAHRLVQADGTVHLVELTPQQAIEYHLAGLAAAYTARDGADGDVASHETTG